MDSKECPTCQRRRGKKYTAEEVVLMAMLRMETRSGTHDFDVDAIAVEAWMIDPITFGMKGHPYPDNKRASATLSLLKAGQRTASCRRIYQPQVEIAYTRHYRLTEAGRARARSIMDQARVAGPSGSLPDGNSPDR